MIDVSKTGGLSRDQTGAGALPSVLTLSDHWRRPGTLSSDASGAKEWSYFCVLTDAFELLVNFSVTSELRDGAFVDVPRLVLMLRDATGWSGSVQTYDMTDCRARAGEVETRFGPHSLTYGDGGYHLVIDRAGRVDARLTLRPESRPALARSVRLSHRGPMRWMVVPRLGASGTLEVDGVQHAVRSAPAYHDRNWGHFAWGGDFSWEWIVFLPIAPSVDWTLVYMQIADRGRNQLFSRSLMVWHRHAPTRVFHAADIHVSRSGLLRPERIARIPAVAALALQGLAADIPERVVLVAARGSDRWSLELDHDDYAQLCLPDDDGCGLTQLSEVRGRARVTGSIDGEAISFESFTLAEYNHAAA
ncbi:hypothetical protein [Piscinibacter koreensis]|uniref:Carotenoid 1,2-hydratase n=1 Tax=Piscinibacter koreensis TaxID=2742824 RepID=A0A7Y6NMF8_9BURK|nr:hypothetical protein [Schlegelella koreensis]NUZ05908.1 hypothetical protein [Schlegelella koreensis]